jgi:hypothetical protein
VKESSESAPTDTPALEITTKAEFVIPRFPERVLEELKAEPPARPEPAEESSSYQSSEPDDRSDNEAPYSTAASAPSTDRESRAEAAGRDTASDEDTETFRVDDPFARLDRAVLGRTEDPDDSPQVLPRDGARTSDEQGESEEFAAANETSPETGESRPDSVADETQDESAGEDQALWGRPKQKRPSR